MGRMQFAPEEEQRRFTDWLWAPVSGRDPDHVRDDVVAEEMSLFMQAHRQNGPGGDR